MSEITPERLDAIEAGLREWDALDDFLKTERKNLADYVSAADVQRLVAALREAWAEIEVMQERETAYMEFTAYMAQKSGIKVPRIFQSRLNHLQAKHGEQLGNASDEATGGGGF